MQPHLVVSLVACTVCGTSTQASASHPLSTEDALTLGSGTLEEEMAAAFERRGEGAATYTAFALRAGLGERLDMGVSVTYALRQDGGVRGAVDAPLVNLKWQYRKPDGLVPGMAIRLDYQPTALWATVLAASWERGPWATHANIRAQAEDGVAGFGWGGSVGGSYRFAEQLSVVGEVEALFEGRAQVTPLVGFLWQLSVPLTLSMGGGPWLGGTGQWGYLVTFALTASGKVVGEREAL